MHKQKPPHSLRCFYCIPTIRETHTEFMNFLASTRVILISLPPNFNPSKLKNLVAFLFVALCIFTSCSESDSSPSDNENGNENTDGVQIYEAPTVRSYVTYTSQTTVTLNGFIDFRNIFFTEEDSYNVGFIFRRGNDPSTDEVIQLEGQVPYFNGTYGFNYDIDGLEPNTTYQFTAHTRNEESENDDWESFTTSAIACTYTQDNYYSIDGAWQSADVTITEPLCCDEGTVEFTFGIWPNIFEIAFNELEDGYPITGQYFGVDYAFDITDLARELTKSTNQVLIGSQSTPETSLFVENDGERITLIFCDTELRNGSILNGKVSVLIP